MSIVVQEPFLWHDTVRNNIDLENTKSDDQIWGVLEKVGLKTTFSNAPRKLETMVEDSTSLSRGEVSHDLILYAVKLNSFLAAAVMPRSGITTFTSNCRIRRGYKQVIISCSGADLVLTYILAWILKRTS